MTENTLKQAIEIKNNLDSLRKRKKELEEAMSLCYGNTGDIRVRTMYVEIMEKGCNRCSIMVQAQTAKIAIENELQHVCDIIDKLLKQLGEL